MMAIKETSTIVREAIKKSKKLREFYLKAKWNEVVGDALCKRSQPIKIEEGILYITVDGSSVANYLRLSYENIILKSNEVLEDNYINEIRIKIGSIGNGGINE